MTTVIEIKAVIYLVNGSTASSKIMNGRSRPSIRPLVRLSNDCRTNSSATK